MPLGLGSKKDNAQLGAKLALRRHFLRTYHGTGRIRVIDCCAGNEVIWSQLRGEFDVQYWPIDVKPGPGRLRLDSSRVLAQGGWQADVVDVDTYGSPWKHWAALLPNVPGPLTVFLTVGQRFIGTDPILLDVLGLGSLRIPPALGLPLQPTAIRAVLARAEESGLTIVEAREPQAHPPIRYLGLHLRPRGP